MTKDEGGRNAEIRRVGIVCFLLASAVLGVAQPKSPAPPGPQPLPPAQAESEARTLIANLLAQRPEKNSTNTGTMKVRSGGKERTIPVRFEIASVGSDWVSIYETLNGGDSWGGTKLTVIHSENRPNQYQLMERSQPGANPAVKELKANETMIPFAGSDFWIADLGLDFLYWPRQRVLRKELRRGQSCDVLESVNPSPAPGVYSRVVSWIDIDNGGVIHADAYDDRNELLKQFDPTELKKVHGQRQLEEMEMRNRKTGSHTWIKFNLE
jgi:hypothetical protein